MDRCAACDVYFHRLFREMQHRNGKENRAEDSRRSYRRRASISNAWEPSRRIPWSPMKDANVTRGSPKAHRDSQIFATRELRVQTSQSAIRAENLDRNASSEALQIFPATLIDPRRKLISTGDKGPGSPKGKLQPQLGHKHRDERQTFPGVQRWPINASGSLGYSYI